MSPHPRPNSTISARLALLATAAALALAAAIAAPVAAAGAVTHYVFSPSPIAPTASLAANHAVAVTLSARDSTNALVPGAVIYLSFSQTTGGGSASVGTTALTSKPVAFTATTGSLTVTYTTPAVLPTGGKDIVKAANGATSATISASDFYSFARASKYTVSPSSIAPPGSLAANATASITLTALNSSSVAVANDAVYLSFTPATGGGSAAVGTTALTATPTKFVTNASGQIVITYKAPATLPATGTDTIKAQDAAKNPTISKTDAYSFAGPASFVFSPNPIGATGALGTSAKVTVTLTALDSTAHPVAGALVFLSFVPTTGGGSAFVGSKQLTATSAKFLTNSSGTITITYTSSATHLTSGTDTVNAGNSPSAPTVHGSDSYTY